MLLAFLIAWLSGLSLPERAQRIAQLYFEAVCQLILDDTGQPHPHLSRIDRLRAEAGIRCAHSFLDIAIWLEACARAGLPRPRNLQPEPYAFARRAPSTDALLRRVTEFVNRWKRAKLAARRLAERMRMDPLRLDAARRSFAALAAHPAGFAGGGKKTALTALSVASTTNVGEVDRWRSQRDGGGLPIRAPP